MKCLILSEFSQVHIAADALKQFSQAQQIDTDLIGQLELILVEAINNVIEHSYQGKAGHPIQLEFNYTETAISLLIKDNGLAVPEYVQQRDNIMPKETELPEGGWGLGLIYILSDKVEFSTQDGLNILRLVKNLS